MFVESESMPQLIFNHDTVTFSQTLKYFLSKEFAIVRQYAIKTRLRTAGYEHRCLIPGFRAGCITHRTPIQYVLGAKEAGA